MGYGLSHFWLVVDGPGTGRKATSLLHLVTENQAFMDEKCILYPLFLLLLLQDGFGQSGSLTGQIVEASTRLPLEFVQIAAFHASDNTLAQGALSDRTGNFQLAELVAGSYYLTVSFIGFETAKTPLWTVQASGQVTNAGVIPLQASDILLRETEVTAEQTTCVHAIDRKIYYPEKDL